MAKTNEQDLRPINMSTRELSTQQQLHSLLQVAGFMWSAVQGPQNPFEPTESLKPHTGEGTIAAENCFIRTCAAIEKIIDDTQRWDFSFQKALEDDYSTAMKLNIDYIRAQRDVAIETASPHHICNPSLVRLQNGDYAAVLGNPASAKDCLVGTGKSPREALEAFDAAFNGLVATQKTNQNEQSQPIVDTTTVETTPEPPKRRRIYPRNKPQPGQDPQVGGTGSV